MMPELVIGTCLSFARQANQILIYRSRVKPQNKKYFAFPEGQIRGTSIAIPSRQEGRIMIVTIVGRVAVDAGSAENERRESVRRRRVVLTPRCWRQVARGFMPWVPTEAKEPFSGESAL